MHHVDRNAGILNPEEKYSLEQRRDYQETFLREVVDLAYTAKTPLKARLDAVGAKPEDIRTIEDLQKISVFKKTDLAQAQKDNPPFGGCLTVPINKLARIHQSPGPIFDPVGRVEDYWRWKTALHATGFRPGDLVVNTFMYHLTPAGHMLEEGLVELGATVIPTGVGNTETQVEIIKKLGVTGYVGTPSFLTAIYKKAEDMGINVRQELKLEVGFLLAEMLPESLRKRFSEEYGLIGRQSYGTADVGCISYECPETNGMHCHYDAIVEICDPVTGKQLPHGETGEVVVTTNNRFYPLVRFGTGDLSSIVEDPCPCGRTGQRMTRIMGRVDQLTKVKGMFVHPSQVERVVAVHAEIARARLLVDRHRDQDIMILEVELKEAVEEGFIPKVEQTIRDVLKLRGSVKILEPGTLAADHKTIDDVRKWD